MWALRAHTETIAIREDDARHDLESVNATQGISRSDESPGIILWQIDDTCVPVLVLAFLGLQARAFESDPRLKILGSARIRWVGAATSRQAYGKTRVPLTRRDGHENWNAVEHATAEYHVSNMIPNLSSSRNATRHEMIILQ